MRFTWHKKSSVITQRFALFVLTLLILNLPTLLRAQTSNTAENPRARTPGEYALTVFVDGTSPASIQYELKTKESLRLQGSFKPADHTHAATLSLKDFDLEPLAALLPYGAVGRIKAAQIFLRADEQIELSGSVNMQPLALPVHGKTTKLDARLEGKAKLSRSNILGEPVVWHCNYHITNVGSDMVDDLTAYGRASNDELLIDEATFSYKQIPCSLSASLKNFSDLKLIATLTSDVFTTEAKGTYRQQRLSLDELALKGPKTKLNGRLVVDAASGKVEIEGQGHCDLSDVRQALALFKINPKFMTQADPRGIISLRFSANGAGGLQSWRIGALGWSEGLSFYGIEATEVNIEFFQEKGLVRVSPLVGVVGAGKAELRTLFDLDKNTGSATLFINELDLAKVLSQLKLKDKKYEQYSGIASLEFYLTQYAFGDPQKFLGEGMVSIKDGNLWQIDFLRGLGEFLFIPDYENVIFNEGYSDLALLGDTVSFSNIELISTMMTLEGAGKLSFDGSLDFMLFPHFDNRYLSVSEGFRKHITRLLGTGGLVISMTGTVQDTTYTMKPLLLSPLGKIKNFFEGILNE